MLNIQIEIQETYLSNMKELDKHKINSMKESNQIKATQ